MVTCDHNKGDLRCHVELRQWGKTWIASAFLRGYTDGPYCVVGAQDPREALTEIGWVLGAEMMDRSAA